MFWDRKFFFNVVFILVAIILTAFFLLSKISQIKENGLSLLNIKKSILKSNPVFYERVTQFIQDNDKEISLEIKKLKLPFFQLLFSDNDIEHFYDIYSKLEDSVNQNLEYYQTHNTWRKADLIYNGETYKIKIKAHGLDPSGHRSGKYISYNIKLLENKQINNITEFNLIIYDRIRDKRLLIFDLAKRFNILINQPELIRVKINNWPEKLYYFEPKLSNQYMEVNDKAPFQIFSSDEEYNKSSIYGYGNEPLPEDFEKYFNTIFRELNYPSEYQKPIFEHYAALNKIIKDKDASKIIEFFDLDYITNFLAARTIAGDTGHGVAKQNFYIFLDTSSGKFYPAFTRDNVPRTLVDCEDCAIEEQMNFWDHFGERQNLLDLLDQNELIRLTKYQKINKFIQEQEVEAIEEHNKIIENDNRLHYFGWIRLFLAKIGLSIDEVPLKHNIEVLKKYLKRADPELKFLNSDDKILSENYECNKWLKENKSIYALCLGKNEEIVIQPGIYYLKENLILPKGYKLILKAGVNIFLDENKSIIGYNGIEIRGTKFLPVTIKAINPDKPFGSVGILGENIADSKINYLHLSDGSEAWQKGAYFSGGLSLYHHNEIEISNSRIESNHADDGLNIKYADHVIVQDSIFKNNAADQIDLDYSNGLVINSDFSRNEALDINGDGLDISGSRIFVGTNNFVGFKDKGISIGERAKVLIAGNVFKQNNNGIAVKDLSLAYILNNTFQKNNIDINVYQKKQIWGGAKAFLDIYETDKILTDQFSNIYYFVNKTEVENLIKDKSLNVLRMLDSLINIVARKN